MTRYRTRRHVFFVPSEVVEPGTELVEVSAEEQVIWVSIWALADRRAMLAQRGPRVIMARRSAFPEEEPRFYTSEQVEVVKE